MLLLTKIILSTTLGLDALLLFFVVRYRFDFIQKILALYIISSICWAFFILINLWQHSLLIEGLIFASATTLISAQFWFARLFQSSRFFGLIDYSVLGASIIFAVAAFLPNALFEAINVTPSGYTIISNGYLSPFFSLFTLILIASSIAILFGKHKKQQNPMLRQQLKFLVIGYIFYLMIGTITNLILPSFFKFYFFNALGPVFSLILVGFIFYIINRYQFLDIKLAIQRSVIYTALLAVITVVYLILVFLAGELFNRVTNTTILISAGLTTVIGIFTTPFIEKYFKRLTDRFFFKDKYDYALTISTLSEVLNVNMGLSELILQVSNELRRIFKIDSVLIMLWSQGKVFLNGVESVSLDVEQLAGIMDVKSIMRADDAFLMSDIGEPPLLSSRLQAVIVRKTGYDYELIVPISLNRAVVGTILLSSRLSGDRYMARDFKLLKTFAYQAAVALEKSRLFEIEKNNAQELEKKILRRTKKILALQEEQRQMMLDISHELQTPLTIAKIEIEAFKKKIPNAGGLAVFEKSIDWISRFIYDLLKLARLEMVDSFVLKKINLSELTADLVEYFEVLANDKKINLEYAIEPNILVLCDEKKIEELITNLVSNAVKFIANERKITVTLVRDRRYAKLVVGDTGSGIKQEELRLVFKRFYMNRRIGQDKIRGSGLGLAICKKIVDGHGGKITIASQENKGTEVAVRLALADR